MHLDTAVLAEWLLTQLPMRTIELEARLDAQWKAEWRRIREEFLKDEKDDNDLFLDWTDTGCLKALDLLAVTAVMSNGQGWCQPITVEYETAVIAVNATAMSGDAGQETAEWSAIAEMCRRVAPSEANVANELLRLTGWGSSALENKHVRVAWGHWLHSFAACQAGDRRGAREAGHLCREAFRAAGRFDLAVLVETWNKAIPRIAEDAERTPPKALREEHTRVAYLDYSEATPQEIDFEQAEDDLRELVSG